MEIIIRNNSTIYFEEDDREQNEIQSKLSRSLYTKYLSNDLLEKVLEYDKQLENELKYSITENIFENKKHNYDDLDANLRERINQMKLTKGKKCLELLLKENSLCYLSLSSYCLSIERQPQIAQNVLFAIRKIF